MTKSPKYDIVQRYYKTRLWTKNQVRNAVIKKWITAEEFEEITGDPFEG